jgi:prepilin-type N-terminal cleavage/methylation domain-containing protein
MKQARGFTLIELAIVLVIMTILIGGLAMPLSAQIQAADREPQKWRRRARPSSVTR